MVSKLRFLQRDTELTAQLELWCLLMTYRKSYMGFSKNPLLNP